MGLVSHFANLSNGVQVGSNAVQVGSNGVNLGSTGVNVRSTGDNVGSTGENQEVIELNGPGLSEEDQTNIQTVSVD